MGARLAARELLAPADWLERPELRTPTARVWQHAVEAGRLRCYVRMSTHCFGERLQHVIDYRPVVRRGRYEPAKAPWSTRLDRRGGIALGGIELELLDFGVMRDRWQPLMGVRGDLELRPQVSPCDDPTYHGLHMVGTCAPGVTYHGRLSVKGFASEIRIARAAQTEYLSRIADGEYFGFRYHVRGALERGWRMPKPSMYVERRGGTAVGFYRREGDVLYALFVRQQLERILPGEWVIDPPITREEIGVNSDDCYELAGNNNLNGYGSGNLDYVGQYGASGNANSGVRFTTVPIPQGSAMNSASLRFFRVSLTGAPSATIFGDDKDNAPTFATGTGAERPSGAGVTQTTASVAMTFGAGNNAYFATNDIGAIVAEIAQRAGWASNNAMRFVQIETTAASPNFLTFRDFQNADSNEPEFDADYIAAEGDVLMAQAIF